MTRAAVRGRSGRRHGRTARRLARGTRGVRPHLGARSSNHAGCHDCAARGTVVLVGRARLFAEPNSRGTAGATGHRALRPMTRAAVRGPSGRRHGRSARRLARGTRSARRRLGARSSDSRHEWRASEVRGRMRPGCHGSSGASPDDPCGCSTPVRTPARAIRKAARPWHPRRPCAPWCASFQLAPRVTRVGSPWTVRRGCHGSSGASPDDPCGCSTPARTPARAIRKADRPWHPRRPPAP